ncbi:winged helix-turn-helix transcriptional regulator [Nocardioides sp. zg-579]|uniref:Winged helix-turn-helix transcriptional regulator n=1 Tax=Nocardioides marmotae TaxID=2663857 RepID=A0A6I3JFG7_9ACTN|nr:Lrp/AsnC family transcriptional regulator [Nocardioides marmotae]MCR6033317.1 winged helix-turn-helix transcriptional regulator [Gordonia jinghuaiqii]MTB96974.1 winged helix-turn-helix transcriptional regulator [Nocardioides marmotae]QKE00646.1 Lrp/AsnC family transcriptional regulator [Nocardioides marmotae]
MDELDGRLLALLREEPRVGVLEASRRLGVARGTVQARLDRLVARGVVTGWGPELEPAALGYPVTAFLSLEIQQAPSDASTTSGTTGGTTGGHDAVAAHLATIPEVLEAHTTTGAGDLVARVVARSNTDLQRVIDAVLASDAVVRCSTTIALATQVAYRTLPLALAAAGRPEGSSAGR